MAADIAFGQNTKDPPSLGSQILAHSYPGIPLSFEQIEKHSCRLKNGSFGIESVIEGRSYRDSSGRLRIESEIRDGSGHVLGSYISIIDVISNFQAILLGTKKIAYRIPLTFSIRNKLFFADAADGQGLPHKWQVTTENIGKRIIEGAEFKGTRTVTSAGDAPQLTTTIDQWYSEKLKLIAEINRIGPYKAYTINIYNMRYGEPDPTLFKIPTDYQVVDFPNLQP